MVHDVDHRGVSNGQLVAESDPLAFHYNNQSLAEQNSITIAWELLMQEGYDDLRSCLFASESDMRRFRQLLVNSVIATDIFDKDLKAMREARWQKKRSIIPANSVYNRTVVNRKATIILEHLIQASDVAHTIRCSTGLSTRSGIGDCLKKCTWLVLRVNALQQIQLKVGTRGSFFDIYVIPLANKLMECQVFGVSCDELLDYALDNRSEWEAKLRERSS